MHPLFCLAGSQQRPGSTDPHLSPGIAGRVGKDQNIFQRESLHTKHMKYLSRPLILLLLLAVLAAVPAASASSGDDNALDVIITAFNAELKTPAVTPCDSPAWKLIYTNVVSPGEEFDADHCIQFVAVRTVDTTLCNRIGRDPPKTKCFAMIAGNTNNPSVCNKMPSSDDPQAYLKIDCLWEVAVKNNNEAACNAIGSKKISRMIVGEMSKQACLAKLASGDGVGESTL